MAERESRPLLEEGRELIGQARAPALARAQDLEPVPLDSALPDVVGRAMDP
jgi:hypothetical protein